MFQKHKLATRERDETKRELEKLKLELTSSNERADIVLEKLRHAPTVEPRLKIVKVKP